MSKRIFAILMAFILIFLCSCLSSAINNNYRQYFEYKNLPSSCYLKSNENPKLVFTDDIDSAVYSMCAQYYIVLGSANFEFELEDLMQDTIRNFCREKRAKVCVYSYNLNHVDKNIAGSSRGIYTYNVKKYDFSIYLLVPMPEEMILFYRRIGFSHKDIPVGDRLTLHRNTGALISVVFEDSPAYYANLSPGDIVIAVNGQEIVDSSSLDRVLDGYGPSDEVLITILREGEEKEISLKPLY